LKATSQIELVSHLDTLSVLERELEGIVQVHELPAKLAFDLRLVLEELVVNIIKHAYPDHVEPQPIRVSVAVDGGADSITIAVEDAGIPFNPLELIDSVPVANEDTVGGFGIFLVRQKTREMSYQRREDSNCLTLKMSIQCKP